MLLSRILFAAGLASLAAAAEISLTLPPLGTAGAIMGQVANLALPETYKAFILLSPGPDNLIYWDKTHAVGGLPIMPDGSFINNDWVADANDVNGQFITALIFPGTGVGSAATVQMPEGAPLSQELLQAAAAAVTVDRLAPPVVAPQQNESPTPSASPSLTASRASPSVSGTRASPSSSSNGGGQPGQPSSSPINGAEAAVNAAGAVVLAAAAAVAAAGAAGGR